MSIPKYKSQQNVLRAFGQNALSILGIIGMTMGSIEIAAGVIEAVTDTKIGTIAAHYSDNLPYIVSKIASNLDKIPLALKFIYGINGLLIGHSFIRWGKKDKNQLVD